MATVKLTGNFLATARCLIFSDAGGLSWNFNQNTNTLTASATSGGTFLSSVGLADTSTVPIYTITNSPLTANGTLDITLNTQAANLVFSGPTTGAAAQPVFRALVAADLPAGTTPVTAYRSADTTSSSNALTADAQLTLTFAQTGKYAIEIFLPFYEATLGTGGFQFDLNSGTATVGGIVFGLDGFVTGAIANAAVTSVATATSASSVATSASAPSWYLAKGWINITVAGTLAVRWAQASTLGADPTTLKAGAYFMATKIG